MPESFAARLVRAREAIGLTRREVAARTGLFQSSYTRLEKGGRVNPSWSTLVKLIGAGLGLEYFFPAGAIEAAASRLKVRSKKKGPPDSPSGGPACCGLRIYRDRTGDRPTIVIVTEIPENPGESVRHSNGRLLDFVTIHYDLDPDTLVWIEHSPPDPKAGRWLDPGELFWKIEFYDRPSRAVDLKVAERLAKPRDWVERMIGCQLGELVHQLS